MVNEQYFHPTNDLLSNKFSTNQKPLFIITTQLQIKLHINSYLFQRQCKHVNINVSPKKNKHPKITAYKYKTLQSLVNSENYSLDLGPINHTFSSYTHFPMSVGDSSSLSYITLRAFSLRLSLSSRLFSHVRVYFRRYFQAPIFPYETPLFIKGPRTNARSRERQAQAKFLLFCDEERERLPGGGVRIYRDKRERGSERVRTCAMDVCSSIQQQKHK